MADPVVFVSYAHEDKPIARVLADGLRSAGCSVWIDEGELKVGDSLVWKVSEAIRGAGFVVALVSEHSLVSKWCQKELGMAVHNQLRDGLVSVLPVRVGEVAIPPPLDDIVYQPLDPATPADAIPPILRAIFDQTHQVTGEPSRLGADEPARLRLHGAHRDHRASTRAALLRPSRAHARARRRGHERRYRPRPRHPG